MPATPRAIETIAMLFKKKKNFSFDGIRANLITALVV